MNLQFDFSSVAIAPLWKNIRRLGVLRTGLIPSRVCCFRPATVVAVSYTHGSRDILSVKVAAQKIREAKYITAFNNPVNHAQSGD